MCKVELGGWEDAENSVNVYVMSFAVMQLSTQQQLPNAYYVFATLSL